ncbi:MAG: hypothetical protein AABX23_00005 [Nanoarchaeota archaeon]
MPQSPIFIIKDLKVRRKVSFIFYFTPLILTYLSTSFIEGNILIDNNILVWFVTYPMFLIMGIPFLLYTNASEKQKEKLFYPGVILAWAIVIMVKDFIREVLVI